MFITNELASQIFFKTSITIRYLTFHLFQFSSNFYIQFNFTDIIALITRMRAVVMIDYGGIMPQLQHQLSSLLQLAQKESQIFQHLRLMVIQEMIYFIHVTELTHFVNSSFDLKLLFVDLEHESPQVLYSLLLMPCLDSLTCRHFHKFFRIACHNNLYKISLALFCRL